MNLHFIHIMISYNCEQNSSNPISDIMSVKMNVLVMEGSKEEFFFFRLPGSFQCQKIHPLSGAGRCLHTEDFSGGQKGRI